MEVNAEQKKEIESHEAAVSDSKFDEISLVEIMYIFKQQWKLVLGIIFSVTLSFVIIMMVWPKTYRAEVYFLPPLQDEIEKLNVVDISEIKKDEVYRAMISNLQSKYLQRQFFDQHNIYATLKVKTGKETVADIDDFFIKKFSSAFTVETTVMGKDELDTARVSLDGANAEKLVQWLDDYVIMIDKFTVQTFIKAINSKIEGNILHITAQVNTMKETASKIRSDELVRLKEAASIADRIGLEEWANVPFYSLNQINSDIKGLSVADSVEAPDYLRGSKALRAEAEALLNRKNMDSFIFGLRELLGELSFLEKLLIDKDLQIHAARIDKSASALKKPVRPKRSIIIIVGFITSIIIASVVAIVRFSFNRNLVKRSVGELL